jgi:putative transposase
VKKNRPKGKVRFGAVLERLIGTTNTEFLHELAGNTQNSKNVRRMTPEVDPRRHALWTLPDLCEYLAQWAFEHYDERYHVELGCSPRDSYERATAELGRRPQRRVVDDDVLHILTCPSTAKGVAKVRPGQGVLVNYHYYWSPVLRDSRVEGTHVPVRYDPFDLTVAYACVGGVWAKCVGRLPDHLQGVSERVLRLASAEVRKQHALRGLGRKDRARQRALFVEALVEREEILRQRLKDEEVRTVYGASGHGAGRRLVTLTALADTSERETAESAREIRTRRIEEM